MSESQISDNLLMSFIEKRSTGTVLVHTGQGMQRGEINLFCAGGLVQGIEPLYQTHYKRRSQMIGRAEREPCSMVCNWMEYMK